MVAANTCHEGVETTSDEERQREEMEEMMAPCWGASDQEMEQPQPQPQISRAEQVSGITPTTQDSQQFGQVVETRAAIPQPRPLPSPPVFPPPANAGESVRPTVEDRRPKRVALDADDEDGSDDNGGHARKRCHGHSRRPSS
jgi:hypothetical protein